MGFRQICGGCTTPKSLTYGVPSNIWGLYTPKLFDGWGSVKYLGAVHPQIFHGTTSVKYFGGVDLHNISQMGFRQIFGGCTPQKYLTEPHPSNIWGVYSPQIFHGWVSVIYMGGLIKKRHMINRHGSKTEKETCKCAGNYGPPFDQCRDTLSPAPHKETAYDQLSCFKNGQRNLQMWGQLRSTMTPP